MKIGPLDFLREGDNGEPWSPTRAWAISTPGAKDADLTAWQLVTTPPPPGVQSLPLHDIKRWMLFGDKSRKGDQENRTLQLSSVSGKRSFTIARRIQRDQAFLRYLTALRDGLSEHHRAAETTLLMPSIDDETAHKRYLNAIREVFPNARVVPEPEMVVEYFRLVRRSLTLDKDRNTIILVLDIGASTSNATIVVSNRGTVTGAETGIRRAGRLRAIQGKCGDVAGQWVDEWLAARIGLKLDELPATERQSVLESIETAKISVSRTGQPASLPATPAGTPRPLRPDDTQEAALEVVMRLRPVLEDMARRLWTQLTGTEEAQRLSEEERVTRKVTGPENVLKLVDFVLLAGGTSRLSGFREFIESELADPDLKLLDVGDDFPIAAAVGALAHVLHDKYSPPRIRTEERPDPSDEPLTLEGALDVDIMFALKGDPTSPGEREQTDILIERGDPIVYSGGSRDVVLELDAPAESAFLARLIPGSDEKRLRKGLSPQPISFKQANPGVGFVIDSDRRIILQSEGIRQIRSIRLDLDRLGRIEAPSARRYQGQIPVGTLAIDHADELVIDVGMSKTVVLAPQTGLLDPKLLELPLAARTAPLSAPSRPPAVKTKEKTAADGKPRTPAPAPEASKTVPGVPGADESAPSIPPVSAPTVRAESSAPASAAPAEAARVVSAGPSTGPKTQTAPAPSPPPTPVSSDVVSAVNPPVQPPPLEPADLKRGHDGFIEALQTFLAVAKDEHLDVPKPDLLFTLLGLSVRPIVLLAGAPGCGKSTLGRIIAHLLRRRHSETFHDIPVQAHWTSDEPLFGTNGLLRALTDNLQNTHLVLFDEFNLARPEYYLARFFHAVERPSQPSTSGFRIAKSLAIGTLNIDETSRAPSPKVLDRCFLVEMDQVSYDHPLHLDGEHRLERLPTLPSLPLASTHSPTINDPLLHQLLAELDRSVREQSLREDLLPSRRVLGDIGAVVDLHRLLGSGAAEILPILDLIDRVIASRVLIKLSGPVEQVEPALRAIDHFVKQRTEELPRTRRRLGLAWKQAKLGFVFPWQ